MATPACLFADGDEAVHRTRHRAAHEQEIPLGIDPDDSEAELGGVAGTHMAGHPLALDDPRRIGTRGDRSRLAVPRVAVRLGAAVKMMTMHDALEAATLGDAAHFHAIAFDEDRDSDRAPGRRRLAADVEAADDARRRLDARLLRMARERLGSVLGFFCPKAELRAPVADGDDGTRPRLDHRHR